MPEFRKISRSRSFLSFFFRFETQDYILRVRGRDRFYYWLYFPIKTQQFGTPLLIQLLTAQLTYSISISITCDFGDSIVDTSLACGELWTASCADGADGDCETRKLVIFLLKMEDIGFKEADAAGVTAAIFGAVGGFLADFGTDGSASLLRLMPFFAESSLALTVDDVCFVTVAFTEEAGEEPEVTVAAPTAAAAERAEPVVVPLADATGAGVGFCGATDIGTTLERAAEMGARAASCGKDGVPSTPSCVLRSSKLLAIRVAAVRFFCFFCGVKITSSRSAICEES